RALAALAFVRDLGVDPREPGLAAEQSLRIAALAHAFERVDDVTLDAGEALEIAVDDRLRLVRLDPQAPRKAPAADAVKDREVHRLSPCAGIAIDRADHLQCGARVDVLPRRERFLER